MKSFLKEFRDFAARGNIVDLAVAVVVGTAFNKIVSSLVDNIIMPTIGYFSGGINFRDMMIVFDGARIAYGMFIQSVIEFIIIAFAVFVFLKTYNTLKSRLIAAEEKGEVAAPAPSEEIVLLREIRDSVKKM